MQPLPKKNLKKLKMTSKSLSHFLKLNESIFSYTITVTNSTVIVEQTETNYSLTMKVKKLKDELQVESFRMFYQHKLAEISNTLHDGAILELVLRTMEILLNYVTKKNLEKMVFVLPSEDAEHLIFLEKFMIISFEEKTSTEVKAFFILY